MKGEVTDGHKIFAAHLTDKRQHTEHVRGSCESTRQDEQPHRKETGKTQEQAFPRNRNIQAHECLEKPNITSSYGYASLKSCRGFCFRSQAEHVHPIIFTLNSAKTIAMSISYDIDH